jgi:hypothetical protein
MVAKNSQKTRRSFGRTQIEKPKVSLIESPTTDAEPHTIKSNTTQHNTHQPNTMQPKAPIQPLENKESFSEITQIRIDVHLFDSLTNAIESAIFGGNYSIGSASHFVREALRDHANGAPLKAPHQKGTKKSLSLRLDQTLKSFWDTLPKRHRNNILERAVRSKLLNYQQTQAN